MTYCELLCWLVFQIKSISASQKKKVQNPQLPSTIWSIGLIDGSVCALLPPVSCCCTLQLMRVDLWTGISKRSNSCPIIRRWFSPNSRSNSATTPLWFLGYADDEDLWVYEPLPAPNLPFPLKHTHIFSSPPLYKTLDWSKSTFFSASELASKIRIKFTSAWTTGWWESLHKASPKGFALSLTFLTLLIPPPPFILSPFSFTSLNPFSLLPSTPFIPHSPLLLLTLYPPPHFIFSFIIQASLSSTRPCDSPLILPSLFAWSPRVPFQPAIPF